MIVLYMQKKLGIKLLFYVLCFFLSNNQVNAKLKISGCLRRWVNMVKSQKIQLLQLIKKENLNDGFFIHAFGRNSKKYRD